MSLGLFKPSISRFRIVAPGYDQNDPTVPPNKVMFDANFTETQRIVAKGTTYIYVPPKSSATHVIATWPPLGYIPLCFFGAYLSDGTIQTMAPFQFCNWILTYDGGVEMHTSNSLQSSSGSVTLYWAIFNTRAP